MNTVPITLIEIQKGADLKEHTHFLFLPVCYAVKIGTKELELNTAG